MAAENRKVAEAYMKAYADADESRLRELVDENAKIHQPQPEGDMDRNGLIESARSFHDAFPDLTIRVVDAVEAEDKVAIRITGSGTHKGEFFGVQPTDKEISAEGLSILTVRDGKIVEDFTQYDSLSLLMQLGVAPELPATA